MSFTFQKTHGADEGSSFKVKDKGRFSNGSERQELHGQSAKLSRLLHFGMSANNDDSEAVKLKSFHPISPDETPQQLKEINYFLTNGETAKNSERILGPTGTVRGVKNIVKSRKESLRMHSDPGEFTEGDDEKGKIVVYTTSFGGVRSTENECRFVTNVFDNLGLKYDLRDIFMQKEYQKELDERIGVLGASVPQVFVNGFHLGGVGELDHLNESEQLKILLSDFEKRNVFVCQTCGGYRYVNCPNCHGSKKARTTRISREIAMLRCTACNENGLQRCPDCSR